MQILIHSLSLNFTLIVASEWLPRLQGRISLVTRHHIVSSETQTTVLYNIYTTLFYLQYLQCVRPSSFMSDRILSVTFTVHQRVLAVSHVSSFLNKIILYCIALYCKKKCWYETLSHIPSPTFTLFLPSSFLRSFTAPFLALLLLCSPNSP